jgi:ABC-type Zn uptake system ZnuABC Zn-binding protein ZnuA
MRSRFLFVLVSLMSLLSVGALRAQDAPLTVVATYSILGDLVQNVAGENIDLTVLVGPDGDSHVYEPTPQDAVTLSQADLIFENGLEFETWLDDLYTASGSTAVRAVVSDGIEPLEFGEGEHDHAGEADHDHGEAPTTLDAWAGEYVSTSAFGIEAFQAGWDAVLATTPELTMDDVPAYWAATSETSFDSVMFDGENVTFTSADGSAATCAYAFVETHPIPQVEGETWSIFETSDAACTESYQYLLLNPIHAAEEGSIPHFHMSYGGGDLETLIEGNGAFFPSLYPAGTTAADIIPAYEANARALGLYMADVLGVEVALTAEEQAMMSGESEAAADDHAHDHEHGEYDPHVWHDPNNAIVMVENIRAALVAADPANAATYNANAETYTAQLTELDAFIREQVATIPEANRILVTSHDTFGYFGAEYGFEIASAIASFSTETAEPNAGEIAELVEAIRAEGVPAVFAENITNPDLLQQIADEAGVTFAPTLYTDALGQPGTPGATYLDMVRYNVTMITAALQ